MYPASFVAVDIMYCVRIYFAQHQNYMHHVHCIHTYTMCTSNANTSFKSQIQNIVALYTPFQCKWCIKISCITCAAQLVCTLHYALTSRHARIIDSVYSVRYMRAFHIQHSLLVAITISGITTCTTHSNTTQTTIGRTPHAVFAHLQLAHRLSLPSDANLHVNIVVLLNSCPPLATPCPIWLLMHIVFLLAACSAKTCSE